MSDDAIMICPEVYDLILAGTGSWEAGVVVPYCPSGPHLLDRSPP